MTIHPERPADIVSGQHLRVGTRACIASVDSVTRALWGQPGTITAINVGTDFSTHIGWQGGLYGRPVIAPGKPLHEITLDAEPRAEGSWLRGRVWRLRQDQLEF